MTLLKTWLEKKAYEVKFTEDKNEVPEIVKEFIPDVVLVDELQKEVLKDLKKYKTTNSTPVLLMTGYTTRSEDYKLPVDDIIEKPFNVYLLEKKIEKLSQARH